MSEDIIKVGRTWFVDGSKKKSGNGLAFKTAFNNLDEALKVCKPGRNDTVYLLSNSIGDGSLMVPNTHIIGMKEI